MSDHAGWDADCNRRDPGYFRGVISEDGGQIVQGYNCIMIFSLDGKKLLMCKRTKDPYMGLYNLVGGKIEKEENGSAAAYRELE